MFLEFRRTLFETLTCLGQSCNNHIFMFHLYPITHIHTNPSIFLLFVPSQSHDRFHVHDYATILSLYDSLCHCEFIVVPIMYMNGSPLIYDDTYEHHQNDNNVATNKSGFLREGGSPQIESITADLNQAARETNKNKSGEQDSDGTSPSASSSAIAIKRSSTTHKASKTTVGVKRETSNSSVPTASTVPVHVPVSVPTIQTGYMRHPGQVQVQVPVQGDMSQYYYYHGVARSPVRNQYTTASYQHGLVGGGMHPSPFPSAIYHGSQDQVPLKSPPGTGGYDINNTTNRAGGGGGMFYLASSSATSPQKLPPSSSSSSSTLPSNSIPKVDSMTSKGEENMMRKMGPLLRSPPPKKRRIVGSWDESDRKEDLDIGMPSPGVFRSPIDGKIRGRGFTMVRKQQ